MALTARFRVQLDPFGLDVDLDLPDRGFTAVIGPSGSGKSTLLRCVAGLTRAPGGYLNVHGRVWQDEHRFVPTHARQLGYVFQDAALFPHLTVRQNLEFGYRRVPASARRIPIDQVVGLLGLEGLLARGPQGLSGGERQRVALARALVTSPVLLLMDEPLASLDLPSRAQILPYLQVTQTALAIPVLYVTHAPAEVARLANSVVFLEQGRVRAAGPINDVFTRPDLSLAHIEDAGAVLDCVVKRHSPEYCLSHVALGDEELSISQRDERVGDRVRVQIRARDVGLSRVRPTETSVSNVLRARVIDIHSEPDPSQRLVRLAVADTTLLARVTLRGVVQLSLAPGLELFAEVKSVALVS